MESPTPLPEPKNDTITEALVGEGFFELSWVKRLLNQSETVRVVGIVAIIGAAIYLPMLGAVGLWDCWEDHYGEVGRMMIQRSDYVFPFWESSWFFSKPPLTMWIQVLGMLFSGAQEGLGPGFGGLNWPMAIILLAVGGALCASPASKQVSDRVGSWKWALFSAGVLVVLFVVVRGPFLVSDEWLKARQAAGPDGPLSIGTEWGMRLPFAIASIAGTCVLCLAVARLAGRRAAYASAVALYTMPLYFLISRQSVTDTPFVALQMGAMGCALIGQFDETTKRRSAWWYAFYICVALGIFAKGLMAGVPAVLLLLYAGLCEMPWDQASLDGHVRWLRSWLTSGTFRDMVRTGSVPMPWLWGQLYRMRLGTGLILFLLIVGPWFAVMFQFPAVDEENQRFWHRFLIHDHFARLGAGVHTTTPGGTFIYFIEQGGFGLGPWVALLPGAFIIAARIKLRGASTADRLLMLMVLWSVGMFSLLAFSATKFHHYILPVLPPVAVLMGVFVDRLWREGPAAHAVPLMAGLALFGLVAKDLSSNPKNFTDLFVYNYDRPYPMTEVAQKAMSFFGQRALFTGDVLAVLLMAFGGYLLLDGIRARSKSASARAMVMALILSGGGLLVTMSAAGRLSPSLFLGLALTLVTIYLGGETAKAKGPSHGELLSGTIFVGLAAALLTVAGLWRGPSGDILSALLMDPVTPKNFMGMTFLLGGGLAALGALQRAKGLMVGAFLAMALVFAGWFNWSHWEDLSHHWTQRDQFWRYYALSKPDEPIAAFLMNWRGETYYSRNRVKQIRDNQIMRQYANLPGRKWALVEHYRLGILKQAVGPDKRISEVDRGLNNKFVLVSID